MNESSLTATLAVILVLIAGVWNWASAEPYYYCYDEPDDCCCAMWEDCIARPDHPDDRCRAGRKPINGTTEANCFATGCLWNFQCSPIVKTGSVTETANGIDDDCDGYIDDEQCDGMDNDGDGLVDEDPGSCLFKILFVPLCWDGSQSEFEGSVKKQLHNFYYDVYGLLNCPDNFNHTILDVSQINISCPDDKDDKNDRYCTSTLWYDEVKQKIANIQGVNLADYNLIALVTDQHLCEVKGRNYGSFLFFQNDYTVVLAHELGHSWGLVDEYCSEEAGGESRCSGLSDINYLGTDLGCDPYPDGCCDECDGYKRCCEGNKAPNPQSDPCNMSYADAGCDVFDWIGGSCKTIVSGNRNFCDRCLAQLINPTNPRTPQNPNGFIPLQCPTGANPVSAANAVSRSGGNPIGPQPGLDMALSVTKEGVPMVGSIDTFYGRPMLWGVRDQGQFEIEILKANSIIYGTAFEFAPGLVGKDVFDEDAETLEDAKVQSMVLRPAVPADVSKTDRLELLVYKDGALAGQTTVNGQPPVAWAGGDQIAECTSHGGGAIVELDATGSNDPDGDTLSFSWTAPGITFDDPNSPTPSAFFPLGDTEVTLSVADGSLSPPQKDVITVTVHDTTPPVLSILPDVTIGCDETVPDPVSPEVSDNCDPNPQLVSYTENRQDDASCPSAYTLTRTWTAQDNFGNTASGSRQVSVVDIVAPAIECNAPDAIIPPQAPVSFIATATDNCDEAPSLGITEYDCFKFTKKGKPVDKKESCVVNITGNTISILDSGGVGDHISWVVRATDNCGNVAEDTCEVEVRNPGKP